jgi:hypothetical protein
MKIILLLMLITVLFYNVILLSLTVQNGLDYTDFPFILFFVSNIITCIFLIVNFNLKKACYYLIVKGGMFIIFTPLILMPIGLMGKDIFNPSDKQKSKIKLILYSFIFYILFTIVSVGYSVKLLNSI